MRRDITEQLKIGEIDPALVKINLRSRDEIPKTLLGLQKIYKSPELIKEILSIMKEVIDPKIDQNNGRPGMTFWKILVLGVIRLICNIDYDKLLELANEHMTLREMLGHSIYNRDHYSLQTLKDNLMLFTPDVLDKINQAVVNFGHENCEESVGSKKNFMQNVTRFL